MQIHGWALGRVQSRCNLARDQPTLSHPRYHDAPGAAKHQFHSAVESSRHWTGYAIRQGAQSLRLDANHVFARMFHVVSACRTKDVSTLKDNRGERGGISMQPATFRR